MLVISHSFNNSLPITTCLLASLIAMNGAPGFGVYQPVKTVSCFAAHSCLMPLLPCSIARLAGRNNFFTTCRPK